MRFYFEFSTCAYIVKGCNNARGKGTSMGMSLSMNKSKSYILIDLVFNCLIQITFTQLIYTHIPSICIISYHSYLEI